MTLWERFKQLLTATVAACLALTWVSGICWALISNTTLTLQSGTGTDIVFQTNGASTRGKVKTTGSWLLSNGALATNATDGFTYLPASSGVPTGAATTAGLAGTPVEINSNTGALYENHGGASTWYPVGASIIKFSGRVLGAATDYLGDAGTAVTTIVLTTAPAYPVPACAAWSNLQVNPVLNTLTNTATVTVLFNAGATSITVSVPSLSNAIVADTTHSGATAFGDTLDIQITSVGGTTGVLVLSATLQCL